MPQQLVDRRDVDFNLYEMLHVDELCRRDRFKGLDRKTLDMILTEARRFTINEMLPTYADGDRIGPRFDNGVVHMPDSFHRVYDLAREAQWTAPSAPEAYGGQGLPQALAAAIREYMMAANWPLASFLSMGNGTARMIALYGSDEQKAMYLENLYTARWGGTMLLTEPDAGTDLGALTTTAVRQPDGTYLLTGGKIFITNGEHDLAENIIHPVLARIEGDPLGTKGISIFIVPKILVGPDGSLGERNDIVCSGIEEKHGIHGSATCSMTLGARGHCVGYLLGKEREGMKIMFNMMNGARLATGAQALAYASHNYLCALDYARKRIQGRDLIDFADHTAPSVPIIRHPDVRRNLLWMKAYTEGLRSLIYYSWDLMDQAVDAPEEKDRQSADSLLELLTPIIKAYASDRGYDVCVQSMQVYGGAGYTRDYPVEAITRDCKITSIFEGANGIQAMDLLGRKLGANKGASFICLVKNVKGIIARARGIDGLAPLADRVDAALDRLAEVAMGIGKMARSERVKVAFAHSVPFLDAMGDVVLAWMHLWRATVAQPKIEKARKKDQAFYIGQVTTAAFFINSVLPVTLGKLAVIADGDPSAVDMPEAAFGGM